MDNYLPHTVGGIAIGWTIGLSLIRNRGFIFTKSRVHILMLVLAVQLAAQCYWRSSESHGLSSQQWQDLDILLRNQQEGDTIFEEAKPPPSEVLENHISPDTIRDWALAATISWKGVCHPNDTLLIAVSCIPESFELRHRVRESYGSQNVAGLVNAKTLFFVGHPQSALTKLGLDAENEEYGDLVQFDLKDSYGNITIKSLTMLNWIQTYCNTVHWFMKIDEDVFLNPFELRKVLDDIPVTPQLGPQNQYASEDLPCSNEIAESKLNHQPEWDILCDFIPHIPHMCREGDECSDQYILSYEEYPYEWYDTYCHGFGYVMHVSMAPRLLHRDRELYEDGFLRNRIEDMHITGRLVNSTNAKIYDYSDRSTQYPSERTEAMDEGDTFIIHCLECHTSTGTYEKLWSHIAEQNM